MKNRNTERRQDMRFARPDHRIVSARIRPGQTAAVVNLSARGVLVETERGLSPGTTVEIQLEGDARRSLVRGRVLRCAVFQLQASRVKYRSAIAFDRHLPWFVDPHGYALPTAEMRAGRDERADATHSVL